MSRTFFAVLAGLLAAIAVMLAMEALAMRLFPPPGSSIASEADLARLLAAAPPAKLAWVLAGWCLAALAGGWVAARLARRHAPGAALAVGALIVAGVALNVLTLPHPWWAVVAGLLLPLPLAWCGARLRGRPRAS